MIATIYAQAIYWDMPHHGICDASDLGLPPGEWPKSIKVVSNEGETLYCVRERFRDSSGAIEKVEYKYLFGNRTLVVYND